jgi:malonyl-CoA O-methyltransferase
MSAVADVDKGKVRQAFAAASLTYDGVAALQRVVGRALLSSIEADSLSGSVLDLGCGTGFLIREILALPGDRHVLALDIALPMLQMARAKLMGSVNAGYVCADAERLPLTASSIDNVYSNLALQWCRHLAAVFTDIRRVLKPGGRLVFTTFGPQTLQELKAAWADVDHYDHVNEFYSAGELRHFLERAGFTDIHVIGKVYTSTYSSVMALMRELKHIGAHNVTAGRNKRLTTRTQMQAMMNAYEKQSADAWISATYEVISVQARA